MCRGCYGRRQAPDGSFFISDAWNRRVYQYARATTATPGGTLLNDVRRRPDRR